MTAIDHVFVLSRDRAGLEARLGRAGLVPSFRRAHPGQGTSNLCYCFDDGYLELLSIDDPGAERDPQVARTGLIARGSGAPGVCPYGIAWRDGPEPPLAVETWDYAAPFLPPGVAIPVALESLDPAAPFLFRSPDTAPPAEWTDGRQGEIQRAAGLTRILWVGLTHPAAFRPGPTLLRLAERTCLRLTAGGGWSLELGIERPGGGGPLVLEDII